MNRNTEDGKPQEMPDRRELERTLKELKEQAEQLRWLARIPEENPDPILRVSADHVLLYSNPAGQELCRCWSCWKGHKVPPVVQEIVSDALIAGQTQHHEITCGRASYWLTATPCAADGYVNIYSRDVTEHKETEDRRAYLASFPQRNPNPILEADLNGDIRFMNPAATRLFPDLAERGISHPWLADWAAAVEPFRRGQSQTGLRDVAIGDRTYQQALYYSAENGFVRIYGFDVTKRKRAETAVQEANEHLQAQTEELRAANEELQAQQEELQSQAEELRRSEQALRRANEQLQAQSEELQTQAEELAAQAQELRGLNDELEQRVAERTADLAKANAYNRSLIEASLDPLVTIGPDGKITDVNAATEAVTGRSRRKLIGTDFCDYFTEPPKAREGYQQVFRDGFVRDYPLEIRHKSGRATQVLYNATVYRDEAGNTVGVFAAARDVTDLRRAELAVRAERQQFVDVLDTLPAYLVLLTPGYHVPFANRFFRDRFGESHGKRCFEYLFNRTEPCENCETYKVLKTNQPHHWEWTGPDGRNYDVYDFPFTDTDGSPLIMETGIDITERKHAEEALKEANETLEQRVAERTAALQDANACPQAQSEEVTTANEELQTANEELQEQEHALRESEKRLQRAQEIAHLGSWELDLATDQLTWSDEVYRIFGLTPREFGATYEVFLDHVHPDDRAAVDAAYTSSLRENRDSYEIEHRIIRKDTGEIRVVHEKCEHIRDAAGRLVHSVGMVHDITERKRMETELHRLNEQLEQKVSERTERLMTTIDRLQDEAARRVLAEGKLRRSSQMLEGFFLHTITPLAFLDPEFKFIRVNDAYAKASDKRPDYFVGRNHFDLYPHEENRAIFEQVVRTKQPYRAYAKPFAYPNDPQRTTYWNWQLTPVLNESGGVQSLVLNLEDVTEQQQAYQELERRTRQMQHLAMELSQAEDRERRRLAEILHDDLQQLLAAAKFHMGILGSRIKDDESLREITEQINHMLKEAIDKSRGLSHELSPAVLYHGDLGETCEWLAQQVQTKHGLKVHVETCGHVDARSEALKAFLYRTAQEMLFNIIKHARSPEARLRLRRVRDEVWLTISDQGRGFDPRTLSRTAGFGLLSIRERVGLLGGRMKIRSAVGRGSTFLIVVPDAEPEPVSDQQDVGDGTQPGAGMAKDIHARQKAAQRLRVLLVDDHAVMREGLATLLNEHDDIEVVGQAANGREAVNLAFELTPDVIIMDSSMPVMAGDEATRQIKRHAPEIRVIALSMFEEPQMSRKMQAAGAEIYLLKTAPSEELLAAIRGT